MFNKQGILRRKGLVYHIRYSDDTHVTLEYGEYQLITLEKPYPAFKGYRIDYTGKWENLKKQCDYSCATYGSKEGEPHIHWPNTITKLQRAHKDPINL